MHASLRLLLRLCLLLWRPLSWWLGRHSLFYPSYFRLSGGSLLGTARGALSLCVTLEDGFCATATARRAAVGKASSAAPVSAAAAADG